MNVQRYTDLSKTQKNLCNINFVIGKIGVAFHVDFGRYSGATKVFDSLKENRHAYLYEWRALIISLIIIFY